MALKVFILIGLLLALSLWVSVGYVAYNRAIVYISYSSMKCIKTSNPTIACDAFYKERDRFLIEYI